MICCNNGANLDYFACCDDSQHQFTENNLFRYCNIGSFDGNMSYEDKDQVAVNEMMIGNTSTGMTYLEIFHLLIINLH